MPGQELGQYGCELFSSAFSPTDTMPLTPRAKILMGIEAGAALMTSLLVIARAVGSLGQ